MVLRGELFGLPLHAVDLILRQGRATCDGHLLLLARGQVLGRDIHDAVGVDVECHLDLGNAARGRRDAHEVELAQGADTGREHGLGLAL